MPKCFSALNDLRQDSLDAIGWNGEPDTIGRRVELWIDGCQRRNADHIALQVHQRSSTVARVNRCISLLAARVTWSRSGCMQTCIQHCLSNLFIEYSDKFPRPWEDIPNSGGKRFREGDVHFPLGSGVNFHLELLERKSNL